MTETLHLTLETLFSELIDGPGADACWMLNRNDVGLLRSLDKLTAQAASAVPTGGGASIAAHVDHLRYGLSLMNRWRRGDPDPWSTAYWTASWKRLSVTDQEWQALRESLRDDARAWLDALRTPSRPGRKSRSSTDPWRNGAVRCCSNTPRRSSPRC